MALDRCGVPVQSDSIIRPAVNYYRRFGGPVNRFLSCYYLGRVHENRGDKQSAMEAFVKADAIRSPKVPLKNRCALQMHEGAIYAAIYDYDRAIEASTRAAGYAEDAGWGANYYQAVLNQANLYALDGFLSKSDSCFSILTEQESVASISQVLSAKGLQSYLMLQHGESPGKIYGFIDSVKTTYGTDRHLWPHAVFSKVYVRAGFPQAALEEIKAFASSQDIGSNSYYFSLLSEIQDSLGDFSRSLDAYKRYVEISDSLDLEIFHQDTRFLEERHALQMRTAHLRTFLWVGGLVAVALVILLSTSYARRRKENDRLRQLYYALQEEYEDFRQLPARMEGVSEEAKALLDQRMTALGAFFTKEQPSSLSHVSTQLETLTENRKELVDTIGLLYAVYHPAFVSRLMESGLTTAEVGYCCLLVLGFRTSEIGDVINRAGIYNISSVIRKKLDLGPNDTNLGIWLKRLYKEMET